MASDNKHVGKYSIGIDLGTTYCCVCVFRNGKVDVITNDNGNRTTPSYVSFLNGKRYVGEYAKDNLGINPYNTVYDAKRLIGRKFNDDTVQQDINNLSFKIVESSNKQISIKVEENSKEKYFCPEEISAIILKKLKSDAEKFLGEEVTDAVITVPAYFGNSQKESTIQAGKIAGLNVLRIINEPTAAAIAYKLENNDGKEKNILVYDLGGGTLDVTLLTQSSGKMIEVRSHGGDTHLGGEDFDNNISNFCLLEFAKKNFKNKNSFTKNEIESFCKLIGTTVASEAYKFSLKKIKSLLKTIEDEKCISFLKGIAKTREVIDDIMNNPKLIGKLKKESEKSKKMLSVSETTSIVIEDFYKNITLNMELTKAKFEELNSKEFKRCMMPVDKVINDCPAPKIKINDITDVVLIGGSTRIPKIRELLKEKFGNKIRCDINPDEAVAYGASVQAAILSGVTDNVTGSIMLLDVTPLTLGIDTLGGIVEPLIKKNTPIPVNYKRIFTTSQDNQSGVTITICEGERVLTKDNNVLGKFDLTGISPAKKTVPKIEVEFTVDADGIISVTATDLLNKNTKNIVIKNNTGRLSDDEIMKMIVDAEKYAKSDKIIKETIEIENKLRNYINKIKSTIEERDFIEKMGEKSQQKILIKLLKSLELINEVDIKVTKEEYEEISKKLEDYITPKLEQYKNSNKIDIE